MIILAFDTTAVTASVALLDGKTVIAESSVHNKLTHSEKILPMADELLKNSGYTIDDVDLLAVSRGPGSFTGVRIGVSTVKGLSFANNIPVIGVSALEALAENVRLLSFDPIDTIYILPSMDARRNELYNSVFSFDGTVLARTEEDRAISCEEVFAEISKVPGKYFICGDGAEKLYSFLKNNHFDYDAFLVPELLMRQNAVSVGKIAFRLFNEGKTSTFNEITPLYLRTSQAERINNKEN